MCAILFVFLIILIIKIINNKNTDKSTAQPKLETPSPKIPHSETNQPRTLQPKITNLDISKPEKISPITPNFNTFSQNTISSNTIRPNISQDEVYNKLKNYLTQQGIPPKCIECLYGKLKIKYSKTDFDKFFNDIDDKNVEENPFTTDFFEFGDACKCN